MDAEAVQFAEFTFHPRAGKLVRAGKDVPLQPKVWELLGLLLSEPGRLWSRDELDTRLWPSAHVTEDSLTQAVRRMRVALSDVGASPRFVETVPRRGYRWMWPTTGQPIVPAVEAAPPTPGLFGRDDELRTARVLLGAGPLLTVLGPGGVGKTLLALTLAAETRAVVVRLGDATDEGDLRALFASALGIPEEHTGWDQVGAAMTKAGERTWVLDEAERVVSPLGAALVGWLAGAPNARFLVTSRVRLGLAAERCLELGGLDRQAAVALYRERASRVDPAARDPVHAVESLVDGLDGLPLAIELAAARRRVLDPAGVRARLTLGLDVLVGDRPDVPARHRSMRAAVQGSWDPLDAREQEAIGRLSQLCGFSADLGEQVLADLGAPLELLERLRDHGFVHRREESDRLDVFAVVRAYAEERLAEHERLAGVRRRVAEVLAARFVALEPGPTAAIAIDRESYTRALDLARDEDLVVVLLGAVLRSDSGVLPWRVLLARIDQVRERIGSDVHARVLAGRRIRLLLPVDPAQALAEAEALIEVSPEPERSEALRLLGLCLKQTPQITRARAALQAAVECAVDARTRGRALRAAALVELRTGRWRAGMTAAEGAIAELCAGGLPWEAARTRVIAGSLAYVLGDLGLAQQSMIEALDVLDRRLDARMVVDALGVLGLIAECEGRLPEAEGIRRELCEGVEPRHSRLILASLVLRRGDPEEARRVLASCPIGRGIQRADHACGLAMVSLATGELEGAEELLRSACALYRDLGFSAGEGRCSMDLALICALRGDVDGAAGFAREGDRALQDTDGQLVASWRLVGLPSVAADVAGGTEVRSRSDWAARIRDRSPIGPTTGRPAPYPEIAMRLAVLDGRLPGVGVRW